MKSNNAQFHFSHFDPSLGSESSVSSINYASMPAPNSSFNSSQLGNLNGLYSADISQTRSETEDFINPDDELEIRVEGIPNTGAKSRVETQIRLSIQLMSKNGVKVPRWSYLRIHESMLAKSKLKKSLHQKLLDGSSAAMVSDESKVLDLEARVVCESDESKQIKMCQGCVRRERKRAERKKNTKPSNYKINPNVVDEKFESDRQRVLIFNCESLVNFSSGEAILPTRITCYCRHHDERIGFRVRFTVRNNKGVVVATGDTPPVMITDDHKTSKQGTSSFITAYNSRKRTRNVLKEYEDESDVLITPASSRRNSFSGSDAESDTNQVFYSTPSSPIASHYSMASLNSNPRETLNSSFNGAPSPQTPDTPNLWRDSMNNNPHGQVTEFKVHNLHRQQHATQEMISYPIMMQDNEFGEYEALPPTRRRRRLEEATLLDTCNPSLLSVYNSQEDYDDILNSHPYFATSNLVVSSPNSSCSLDESNMRQSPHTLIPILNNITPSQGPTFGGIEVSIEGEGFHQDLTLMFGNRAATTVYCSPTFMVCILPPTEKNESVTISFKDHPLLRSNDLPPFFDYYEQDKTKLLGFFPQAIGKNSSAHQKSSQWQTIESELIQTLSENCFKFSSLSSQTNMGGQNLLHLASYFNLNELVKFLLRQDPNMMYSVDRNGLTPLHFGCLRKSTLAIRTLVDYGASVAQQSNIGTSMDIVASSLNPLELQDVERRVQQGGAIFEFEKDNSVSWLPNSFVHAATQFCQQMSTPSLDPFTTNFFVQQQPMANPNSDATLLYNV